MYLCKYGTMNTVQLRLHGAKTNSSSWCKPLVMHFPAATRHEHRRQQLHAASHRGLCLLHRAIASVPKDDAERVFAPAIRRGRELALYVDC